MAHFSLHGEHTIFHLCKINDFYMVKELIQSNQVDKNIIDVHGNSLLYYACLCGSMAVVHYLCSIGLKDDKYHRCYWNALSLEVRSVLKLYNNYKSNVVEGKRKEARVDESSLGATLDRYVKRIIYQSQNNEDFDIVLRMKFSDHKDPIEYKCHWWIILARWPEIIHFVDNCVETNITFPTPFVYADYASSLKSNKKIEEELKIRNPHEDPKKLYHLIKKEKQRHQKLKESYSCYKLLTTTTDSLQEFLPSDLDGLQKYMDMFLRLIDFGPSEIPVSKSLFEYALIWVYTDKIPESQEIRCQLLEVAVRFKLNKLYKILFESIQKRILDPIPPVDLSDLSIVPLLKPIEMMNAFEKMRRLVVFNKLNIYI